MSWTALGCRSVGKGPGVGETVGSARAAATGLFPLGTAGGATTSSGAAAEATVAAAAATTCEAAVCCSSCGGGEGTAAGRSSSTGSSSSTGTGATAARSTPGSNRPSLKHFAASSIFHHLLVPTRTSTSSRLPSSNHSYICVHSPACSFSGVTDRRYTHWSESNRGSLAGAAGASIESSLGVGRPREGSRFSSSFSRFDFHLEAPSPSGARFFLRKKHGS